MVENKIYVLDVESTGVSNHPKHGHTQVLELAHIQQNTNFKDQID